MLELLLSSVLPFHTIYPSRTCYPLIFVVFCHPFLVLFSAASLSPLVLNVKLKQDTA